VLHESLENQGRDASPRPTELHIVSSCAWARCRVCTCRHEIITPYREGRPPWFLSDSKEAGCDRQERVDKDRSPTFAGTLDRELALSAHIELWIVPLRGNGLICFIVRVKITNACACAVPDSDRY
jgi:hypothetical protein